MKKLVAPGVSLITSHPRFGKGRRFQKWPTHAVFFGGIFVEPLGSVLHTIECDFRLKDGHLYFYGYGVFQSTQQAGNSLNSYHSFQSANGRVGYLGEWFNSILRGQCNQKIKAP
jgi:hypothetical protein